MLQLTLPAQHRRGKNPGERPIAWRKCYRLGSVGMIREHLLKGTLINQHARNQSMREVARR